MKKLTLVLLCALLNNILLAQRQTNHWLFGYGVHLNFNNGNPDTILNSNAIPWLAESTTSYSNPTTGRLLFYSNGERVWDSTHQLMPALSGGQTIGGNQSSTQSSIVVPMPLNDSLYYIFTSPAGNNIGAKYSIINMKLNGGKGDVVLSNQLLYGPVAEKMAAVHHANGRDVWIVYRVDATTEYYAYLVTPYGVNLPVISPAINTASYYNSGNMKFSPDGKKFVEASHNGFLHICSFNNLTGILTSIATDTFMNSGNYDLYGVSFSPDSKILYVKVDTSSYLVHLYQYNVNLGSAAAILASKYCLYTAAWYPNYFRLMGLQLASNGKIYIVESSLSSYIKKLAVINQPNLFGTACNFQLNSVILGPTLSSDPPALYIGNSALPSFIESSILPPIATFTYPHCSLVKTDTFYHQLYGDITYLWNFNDPLSGLKDTSSQQYAQHNFVSTGYHTIQCITHNAFFADTFYKTIYVPSTQHGFAGADTLLNCTTTQATLGTLAMPHGFYTWHTAIGLNDSTLAQPICTATATCTYICGFTDTTAAGACTSLDTCIVQVHRPVPQAIFTKSSNSVCLQEPVLITYSGNATATMQLNYNFGNATILNGSGTNAYTISYNTAGWHSISLQVLDSGCVNTYTDSVFVKAAIPNTNLQISICSNGFYTSPSGQILTQSGLYHDTLTASNGCDSVIIIQLQVTPISQTSHQQSICAGNTYTLPSGIVVSAAGIYTDTLVNYLNCDSIITTSLQILQHSSAAYSIGICPLENIVLPSGRQVQGVGIYQDTIINQAGCDSVLTITTFIKPIIYTSQNINICEGDTFVLPSGKAVTNTNTYIDTLHTQYGCDTIFTSVVTVVSKPKVHLGADSIVCLGQTIILNLQYFSGAFYNWNTGNTTLSQTVQESGIYSIEIKNPPCPTATDSVQIKFIDCNCSMAMPNAFSPNGDQISDVIKPIFACDLVPENYDFKIYNRWGQLLFVTQDYTSAWQGLYKNIPQENDTYIYYIQYTNPTTHQFEMHKGDFILVR